MKTFKLFGLIFLLIGVFSSVSVAQQVLSSGFNSKVDAPFVFVARDEKAYSQLQNLVEDLPSASTIDFKRNAVIAGFAGTRPTGGWTVEIKKSGDKFSVIIQPPGKDMMVTQAITTPFKVSIVPLAEDNSLPLNLAPAFINKMQNFLVNKGNFQFSGGIAGIRKHFKANGTVRVITFGDYTSIWFDLKGKGKEVKRRLSEIASGTIKNGKIELSRLDAGSFADSPRPPFEVKGTLKSKILSLNFEPLPTNVADGYEGRGSLEAIKVSVSSR